MNKKQHFLDVKDHSITRELFQLIYNKELDMLETHPQPSPGNLHKYYESEDYISHTDSRRNLLENIYHFVRKFTLSSKVNLINNHISSNKSLLDIGCGTGDFLYRAMQSGWNVTGIEPNVQARKIANSKIHNRALNSSALFELNEQFDVITLWHVLEHVPNLEAYIKQIKLLLNPKGVLIIAVPNYKSFDATYYKSFWAAYDVPRHLWHFSKLSISKLFGYNDFEIVDIKPMFFDAFYVSLLSEKYKESTLGLFKAFFIGLYSNIKGLFSKEYSSHIYILKKK